MDPSRVKEKLIAVIEQIQESAHLDCPPLTGTTKPAIEVPKFKSPIWLIATTLLAIELDIEISNKVNLFIDKRTKLPRSIDETVGFVCGLLDSVKEAKTA